MSIVRSPTRPSTSLDCHDDVFSSNNIMLLNSQQASSNGIMSQSSESTMTDKRPPGRPRKNTTSTGDITLEQIKSLLDQQTVSIDASIDAKLSNIIDTFKSFTVTVNKKFATIDAELGQLNNNVKILNTTIGNNSTQIKTNTSTIADNQMSITQMSDDINNSKLILERMPNVIVFGIPEDPDNELNVTQRVVSDRGKVDQLIQLVFDSQPSIGTVKVTSSRIHPHSGALTKPRMTKVKFNNIFYKDIFVQRFMEMKKAKSLTGWMAALVISQDFTPSQLAQRRQLKTQLAQDGVTNPRIRFINGVFKVQANTHPTT
ncbi:uncharacterized protein LOC122849231 [Aphidius gifuensis]|uniref:uncharacterized protein LOC122849231 n=1 Tax=Aphidius gifuensis TaxID=684658 RepID=UPI001CDB84A8|nr:uncharacterized protein LOC122849231 [Aphidius gifuensis]